MNIAHFQEEGCQEDPQAAQHSQESSHGWWRKVGSEEVLQEGLQGQHG